MKKNIGTLDELIRLSLAFIIGSLFFTNTVTGLISLVLLFFMAMFLVTTMFRFSPIYYVLGICSNKNPESYQKEGSQNGIFTERENS